MVVVMSVLYSASVILWWFAAVQNIWCVLMVHVHVATVHCKEH